MRGIMLALATTFFIMSLGATQNPPLAMRWYQSIFALSGGVALAVALNLPKSRTPE